MPSGSSSMFNVIHRALRPEWDPGAAVICESESLTMEWEMSFDSTLNGETVAGLGSGTGAHNLWTHECRGWT